MLYSIYDHRMNQLAHENMKHLEKTCFFSPTEFIQKYQYFKTEVEKHETALYHHTIQKHHECVVQLIVCIKSSLFVGAHIT